MQSKRRLDLKNIQIQIRILQLQCYSVWYPTGCLNQASEHVMVQRGLKLQPNRKTFNPAFSNMAYTYRTGKNAPACQKYHPASGEMTCPLAIFFLLSIFSFLACPYCRDCSKTQRWLRFCWRFLQESLPQYLKKKKKRKAKCFLEGNSKLQFCLFLVWSDCNDSKHMRCPSSSFPLF